MPRFHYTYHDVVRALQSCGIKRGDIVFSHISLLPLGIPEEAYQGKDSFDVVLSAMLDVLGPEGSFFTPTYSYSFCARAPYDPVNTPSEVGPFGNRFRKLQGVKRSSDPIFSVAGIGPAVDELFRDLPNDCFGPDCLYARLETAGAKLCQIGLDIYYFTGIHYLEQACNAPHRYRKLFSGVIREGNSTRRERWIYSVRTFGDFSLPQFDRAQEQLIAQSSCNVVSLGLASITVASIEDIFSVARRMLIHNPMCFARDPDVNPLEEEIRRVPPRRSPVTIPRDASLQTLLASLSPLPRDIVSDGYDDAIDSIASIVPMHVHAYPTGEECFSWIVPEKWTCREARLETLDGETIFSSLDHRLHVISYSLPFDGEVNREELFKHLYTHDTLQDAIPFIFKYYERDWGLCCTQEQKESLEDDAYRVVIDAEFSKGELKVGEILVRGASEESFILCTHLCHPCMANDDTSGVVAAIEISKRLKRKSRLRYTYRILFLPETIGSAAYLSHNMHMVKTFRAGLFLEMLATVHPYSLQFSLEGNSEIDQICSLVVKEHDPESWCAPFGKVVLNDERMFNSQGINVPMASLSRVLPPSHKDHPYRGYHTSLDNVSSADIEHLEDSVNLTMKIIEAFEANRIPVPLFTGEIFISRFNKLDYGTMAEIIHSVTYYINGRLSISEIADKTGFSFSAVENYLNLLYLEKLIDWK